MAKKKLMITGKSKILLALKSQLFSPEVSNLICQKPGQRGANNIRHRNDSIHHGYLAPWLTVQLERRTNLFHGEAKWAHVDDQVRVEHHKAGTLEEEDELDPYEVGFAHIPPEPAEKNV